MSRPTPAEQAAIEAIGKHGTVKAAAHALGKSPRTVEHQLKSARERFGVDTTVQLIWVKNTDTPNSA